MLWKQFFYLDYPAVQAVSEIAPGSGSGYLGLGCTNAPLWVSFNVRLVFAGKVMSGKE